MAITNVHVKNTNTNLLVVPSGERYAITAIMLCNTFAPDPANESAGSVNINMHFISSGSPKSDNNMVINQLELRAGETFSFDTEKIIIDSGDRIVLIGSPAFDYPPVSAGLFEVGKTYEITTLGTTDWNLVTGTVDETYTVGDTIIASNTGNGNGEAKLFGYSTVTATVSFLGL